MDLYQHALNLYTRNNDEESIPVLQKLLSENPTHFAGWNTLGQIMLRQKKYDDALAFFTHSASLQPSIITAKLNIVQTLRLQKKYELAKSFLDQITQDYPHDDKPWGLMYDICQESYDFDGMIKACKHLSLSYQLAGKLSLPVCLDRDETDYLNPLDQAILAFDNTIPQKQAPESVPNSIFQLAYLSQNPRPRLEAISNLYRKLYPVLNYISPNIHKKPSGKPKIGIVTAYLDKFHAISFCYASLIKNLAPHFDLIYFRLPATQGIPSIEDDLGFKKTIDLSHILKKNQQIIESQQVDLLWYLDVNMTADTYFLAHARLAPIQMVSAGHPCTTGVSTLDYFISSTHLESQNAQDNYTETVIQLPTLPMIYQDYDAPDSHSNRKAFDLPEDKNLYFCAQTLFKVHPKMDALFKGILDRDENALIVFSYEGTFLADQLRNRLGAIADRCLFIPTAPQHIFFHLLASVDVILDTTPFGSGNTLCQSLAVGTPTICFDTADLRSAGAPGLYRLMGIEETIVLSEQDYIERAVTLATTQDKRTDLKRRILDNKHKVFEDSDRIINAYVHMITNLVINHSHSI